MRRQMRDALGLGPVHGVRVSAPPDSVEIEDQAETGGDDYISWTVALTYELAIFGGGYYCGDMYTNIAERTNFTYHVKYSLWRTPVPADMRWISPGRMTDPVPMLSRCSSAPSRT